ncbi:MAG: betaine/proline/choline family ABC transporter ATP-binding protein [Chloroflexi bacterium]|nr:betaine/proline/choline family ABC transporter ATP-binding protein [Chloroflexota bacterium]
MNQATEELPELPTSANGEVRVSVRGLWKVFGPADGPDVGETLEGKTKDEVQDELDSVLALHDVSFDVHQGETFVVMGLSGSGKSTLVRCLIRLIEPTVGEVIIDGEDILSYTDEELTEARRQKTGMVFQYFGLLPHRTVIDNVAWGLEVQGVPREDRRARAAELLRVVGLDGWEEYHAAALSGGMQQRVGLARALACDPEILLMDEPFSALDPLIRRDMQDELIRLQEQLHKTIVFITHDLAEATKLGSRIAIMRDGAIVQIGTPEEIMANPIDDYVADFTRDVRTSSIVTVGYVMERCGVLLKPTTTARDALAQLESGGVEAAFVIAEDGRYRGEICRQEARDAAGNGSATIEYAVSRRCEPVLAGQCIEDALSVAWPQEGKIPVVDDEERLVGMIERDVLAEAVFSEEREEAGA